MKIKKILSGSLLVLALMAAGSCSDQLSELNENPNGVNPEDGNPNMIMPTVQSGLAMEYLRLGFGNGNLSGVIQHTQEDGWFTSFNHYDWTETDWSVWYGLLRNNKFMMEQAVALDYPFHQGVALTLRAFIYGTITDLWGDAPYTEAVKGDESDELLRPVFDSQETIYKGIIEDLKAASALFAGGDKTGYLENYDIYYNGNTAQWQQFAGTLLLRYSMRLSEKLPELARSGVESVYSSGVYIEEAADDAVMDFPGTNSGNSWPLNVAFNSDESNWRRRKPCQTLLDKLLQYGDPRLEVWVQPVHVQWVANPGLATAVDPFIRQDGVILNGVKAYTDEEFQEKINQQGHTYTRHFNPSLYQPNPPFTVGPLNTAEYVGLPPGLLYPDYHNMNPTTGQSVENQHVSQIANLFKGTGGGLLKARLASAAETHFILAEAALKGWSAGNAKDHYEAGVRSSMETWGVDDQYASYIAGSGVAFNNTLARIMEQKWIAAWTSSAEAWFDFRRTGLPALSPGPASSEPVLPLRFIYGNDELFNNTENANAAVDRLEETSYSGPKGKNSQWSKPWILQGTGEPW
ncbi:SusD-like starch-binding protein associating with outer membrane [Anseongella ginsenosidimutans]|uniref:SusD-like starch-binding protein associating with outer membrane n=1 Tax=Anseongella ginsenosidimutans TaxID=496056 RepID=A0A4R3KMI6_9SPHI|nr:SusD/RagB family nutrient-binding outer membrane lipoprotein [Anseongella ginsenosidimutans]QEC52766.1 SusD/RagB family nutrient-binding outer membrane lipoprotein [Anseongella ginsenosidimutans]TCS85525.1 SusD-like starch-binding protein associating with outer membrane [Anseongella ginsenosidimutans]